MIWNKDPLGNPYFWLSGSAPYSLDKNSDCWELLKKGNVVITPLDLHLYTDAAAEELEKWFEG